MVLFQSATCQVGCGSFLSPHGHRHFILSIQARAGIDVCIEQTDPGVHDRDEDLLKRVPEDEPRRLTFEEGTGA